MGGSTSRLDAGDAPSVTALARRATSPVSLHYTVEEQEEHFFSSTVPKRTGEVADRGAG